MSWIFDRRKGTGGAQTGMCGAADVSTVVLDSAAMPFDPASCAHKYTYDDRGALIIDTATEPVTGLVRLKTYTYAGSILTAESMWVKQ